MTSEDLALRAAAELAAVAHLIELGYEDPREAARRRRDANRLFHGELAGAQKKLDAGQLDEAIEALAALSRAAPEWAPPRQLLATACFRAGQFSYALVQLDWLELHAVEHAQLALMRAAIELSQRRLDAALETADYARRLDASLPGPEIVIGEVKLRRGDLDAAEAAYQRATRLAPDDCPARTGLAAVALRRGSYEAAVDFALRAFDLNPEAPLVHYCMGAALALLGKYAESRRAFETFARLSPHRAAPYRWLAIACTAMGDCPMAEAYRERGRRTIQRRRAQRKSRAGCDRGSN